MGRKKQPAKIDTLGHRAHVAWTPERREKFLARLSETGNVQLAAALAGVSRRHAHTLRQTDPAFAQQWVDALDDFADRLEEVARRRAVDGYDQPIVRSGKVVSHQTVYSDRLLERLLEAHRPQKYSRRKTGEQPDPHDAAPAVKSPFPRVAKRISRYIAEPGAAENSEGRDGGGEETS